MSAAFHRSKTLVYYAFRLKYSRLTVNIKCQSNHLKPAQASTYDRADRWQHWHPRWLLMTPGKSSHDNGQSAGRPCLTCPWSQRPSGEVTFGATVSESCRRSNLKALLDPSPHRRDVEFNPGNEFPLGYHWHTHTHLTPFSVVSVTSSP